MIVYLAADHGGLELKNHLCSYIARKNINVIDLGTDGPESVDYPDYANSLAVAMKDKEIAMGILVCGSGIGISMAANRHNHIRAALVNEPFSAQLSRRHNNANVLCLSGRLIGTAMAQACVDAFFDTAFEGGRHAARVAKIS
jgi:ribose 5-phosphate isomerase B